MDKSAIETIAKLAISAENNSHAGDFLLRFDSQTVEPLERFQTRPNRFRGTFSTNVLKEFTGYVTDNADEDSALYVNPKNGTALAFIDQGDPRTPNWGEHTARLDMVYTPEYKALLEFNDTWLGQLPFIDFIEDQPECFRFFDGDFNDYADVSATVAKLRRLKVDSLKSTETVVGNFAHHASAMEQLEIKAAGLEIPPAGFDFTAAPYDDFEPFTFRCRLRANADGDRALLKYRIFALDASLNRIADELVEKLKDQLREEPITIYLGEMTLRQKP